MQDTAKTAHWKQRENTYIHKQRLSAMCTSTQARTHTLRQTNTHTHTDAYWLNRKTSFSSVDCKSISLPTSMEIKLFHVPGLRGFLHLVVAAELDTPSQPPLPHAHIYMLTHTHAHRKEKRKWTFTTKTGCHTRHSGFKTGKKKIYIYSVNFFK